MGASDASLRPLQAFLKDRVYDAHTWELGRNLGLRAGLLDNMMARLDAVAAFGKGKVSLIGWSLGGLYARELAKRAPEMVRSVISLGSPFGGDLKASNAWRFYEFVAGHRVESAPIKTDLKTPLPVPTTAIFARKDGIVAWEITREVDGDKVESIEVRGSHCGLGVNPSVLYAIADRLAQPEGEWAPFERSGPRAAFFPNPDRGMAH